MSQRDPKSLQRRLPPGLRYFYVTITCLVLFVLLLTSCPQESLPPFTDNREPTLDSLRFIPDDSIGTKDSVSITCWGSDPDGDPIYYLWSAPYGGLKDTVGQTVWWKAQGNEGQFPIIVTIKDRWQASFSYQDTIYVISDESFNEPPEIEFFEAERDTVAAMDTVQFFVQYTDVDDPMVNLTVEWFRSGGWIFESNRNQMTWIAPQTLGMYRFIVSVSDLYHTVRDSASVFVAASGSFNTPPAIERVSALKPRLVVNDSTQITCTAVDTDNDPLIFRWSSNRGTFRGGGNRVQWIAPSEVQLCTLNVEVYDGVNSTRGYTTVNVVPDTIIYYETSFVDNDVTNQWSYEGPLSGLGDNAGVYLVAWDSLGQRMNVTVRTAYATFGFRLRQLSFLNGSFHAEAEVPNTQYGMVAFLPKFMGESNYFLVGLDFYHGMWQVLRCVNGNLEYVASDWSTFAVNRVHSIDYNQADGVATVFLDGMQLWSGDIGVPFENTPTSIGIGVYGLEDSGPMYFDNFRVTDP